MAAPAYMLTSRRTTTTTRGFREHFPVRGTRHAESRRQRAPVSGRTRRSDGRAEARVLGAEASARLCRVGRGTPMGELMRQYWLPAALSSELPEHDGAPLRVRLLGEDLIAVRVSSGCTGASR